MEIATTDMRDAFFQVLLEAHSCGEEFFILCDDFSSQVLEKIKINSPQNVINVGICEQNIVSVAAGLALSGKKVFAYAIAPFMTLRCLEQIKIDLCCMKLPVTLLGVGAGFAYAADGPTHHATEDIGVLGTLAHMTIYSPSDTSVTANIALRELGRREGGPAYLRLDRGRTPVYDVAVNIDKGYRIFGEGEDVVIITTGTLLSMALEAQLRLIECGIAAQVVDVFQIKPFPSTLLQHISNASHIATLEEHCITGGLGATIALFMSQKGGVPQLHFALDDAHLYAYGHRVGMLEAAGISPDTLVDRIRGFFYA